MEPEEAAELQEEVRSLRTHVARLSESVADRRARVLHLEGVISHLRLELRAALATAVPPTSHSGEGPEAEVRA